MPFCSNCGKEYASGSKFCSECGSRTGDSTSDNIPEDPVIAEDEQIIWEGKPSGITSGVTSSSKYILTNQRIRVISGRIGKKEEEIELIRVKDLSVKQGLKDRAVGVGDIEVISADETKPKLTLKDIKDPASVKEIIRNLVRKEKANKMKYQERI